MTLDEGRPRSALQLLGDSRFGRYFAGSLLSNIGTWCHDIAAAIFVFQVTGLASMVAIVAVAAFGLSLVTAPISGLLADRFDRRTLLLVTMLVQGLVSTTFALIVAAGVREVWLVLVVTGLLGMGRSVSATTLQSYMPSLVPPRDLAQASALTGVTFNLARAVGPVLGALLITVWGPAVAFGANAASFFVFAAVLVSLRSMTVPKPRSSGGILGGFRHVRARPQLILLIVLAGVVGFATDPVITLGPSFAEHFGQPAAYAGWLVSAFGAGAVCAAPFLGGLRRALGSKRLSTFGFLGLALGFLAAGIADSPWVTLGAMAVAGFCFLSTSSDITTSLLEQLDDTVRGRVMAIWTIGFQGGRPLAALLDGALTDAFAPEVAMLAMAGIMIVACAVVATLRRRPQLV